MNFIKRHLTAIYLMVPVFFMYFRPLDAQCGLQAGETRDPGMRMKLPFAVLVCCIVLCGLFSDQIVTMLTAIAAGVM